MKPYLATVMLLIPAMVAVLLLAASPPPMPAPHYLCGTREQAGKVTRWGVTAERGEEVRIILREPTTLRFTIQDEPCEWMRGRP